MKKLHELIARLRAWIEEQRRKAEIELIRAELHELRHWRELGTYREPRLYKRLVELGERVPGYMPDAFEPDGLVGAWKGPA